MPLIVHDHDALARAFERVGKPGLCRTALRDLVLHHGLDVFTHDPHGCEQGSQFIRASLRNLAVQLTIGNSAGHRRCGRHRADDAVGKQPGHEAREEHGKSRAGDIELGVRRDRRARPLAIQEGIPGRIIDQQIDLLIDDRRIAIELVPVDVGRGALEQTTIHVRPRLGRLLHLRRRIRGAARLRTRPGDLQVVGQRLFEGFYALVGFARIGPGDRHSARERRLHGGEIGRSRPSVVDRHQGFVESLVDQDAGAPDPHRRVPAEYAGDHAHDQKSNDNATANRPEPRGRPCNRPPASTDRGGHA